jgi:hypothetical protein
VPQVQVVFLDLLLQVVPQDQVVYQVLQEHQLQVELQVHPE